jgi:O-antigen biosynthesis protein WbqP
LRKFSLDELPNLFNVLKGDMVFVGPRPALHNQHDLIELRKKEGIDKIKPGITGWAQVNGRDELTIEEKIKYDKEYIERKSFFFDLKILFLTFFKVFLRSGVNH